MSIKNTMVKIAEKITGRKCSRCHFNVAGRCCHPNGKMFCRCWQSITRPGYKESRQHIAVTDLPNAGAKAPGDLTEEEKYKISKIAESLKEASETAKAAGLLDDTMDAECPPLPDGDDREAVPAYLDDKNESGLLEEE